MIVHNIPFSRVEYEILDEVEDLEDAGLPLPMARAKGVKGREQESFEKKLRRIFVTKRDEIFELTEKQRKLPYALSLAARLFSKGYRRKRKILDKEPVTFKDITEGAPAAEPQKIVPITL